MVGNCNMYFHYQKCDSLLINIMAIDYKSNQADVFCFSLKSILFKKKINFRQWKNWNCNQISLGIHVFRGT